MASLEQKAAQAAEEEVVEEKEEVVEEEVVEEEEEVVEEEEEEEEEIEEEEEEEEEEKPKGKKGKAGNDKAAKAFKELLDQFGEDGVAALAVEVKKSKGALKLATDIAKMVDAIGSGKARFIRMKKYYKPHHMHGWLLKGRVYDIKKIGVKGVKGLKGVELAAKLITAGSARLVEGTTGVSSVVPPTTLTAKKLNAKENSLTLADIKKLTASRRA